MQQLLNPFAQKYPEAVDSTLSSQATCIAFNPFGPFAGHYLAAGGSDGVLEIWDVETKGLLRVLEGHVRPISSVCWSRNNRYLLSSSLDSTAIIWDLSLLAHPLLNPSTPITQDPSSSTSTSPTPRLHTIRLEAPISSAQFHPRNSKIILATLTCHEIVLIDLRAGGGVFGIADVVDEDMEVDGEAEKKRATLGCAAWSPCGTQIYVGTSKGELLIFDPPTRNLLSRYKVANSSIKSIAFDTKGSYIILSSLDRALRLLHITHTPQQPNLPDQSTSTSTPLPNPTPLYTTTLTPTHRFQDLVNRTSWNSIGFSGDGEYVMAGAGQKVGHNVFIWDRDTGVLIKVLEGPRESLIGCDWHPTRPVIASVATSGDIHIWHTSSPDNWAAFAPGFEELEENIEYDEREDEFDIEDETELSRRKNLEEDVDIDVLSPPDDAWPRRPGPLMPADEVIRWADAEPDGDTWEGFYMSLDLLEETLEVEDGAG